MSFIRNAKGNIQHTVLETNALLIVCSFNKKELEKKERIKFGIFVRTSQRTVQLGLSFILKQDTVSIGAVDQTD